MDAIFISNLSKKYASGTVALDGIDLQVPVGGFSALLGMNGAGKTTTIGILTGLVNKTAGQVKVFGYDLDTQLEMVKQQIGVVPQEFNFNIFEKVIDIVVNQAGYYGIPRPEATQRADEVLAKLGLTEKRNKPSRELSGGMKRRLMIARALVHKPRLLILDEPTAGVDVELRRGMWDYLRELNAQGVTILLTTHYLEEVEQLCQSAAVINKGKIILNDTVQNLMRSVDREVYVAAVNNSAPAQALKDSDISVVDEQTVEVAIHKGGSVTAAVAKLENIGITVTALRPKSNRMEELFLGAVKKHL